MKTLCIVPCGSKKIWDKDSNAGPTRAKEVYIGPFAKKCREYAEKFYPFEWCILSAKYGFLFPEDKIPGPYNVSFNDKNTKPINIEKLSKQMRKKKLDKYEKIITLGGKNYTHIVSQVFPSKSVTNPLENCKGIGFMMGLLTNSIKNNKQL
jgi:hypothetical protein